MDKNLMTSLTTLSIQIGAILFLLFGVRILFRLFNYNMKMAAFYNSKADALEFDSGTNDIEKIKAASEVFAPLEINFDKVPDHPYKEFADIARRVILKNAGIEDTDFKKKRTTKTKSKAAADTEQELSEE